MIWHWAPKIILELWRKHDLDRARHVGGLGEGGMEWGDTKASHMTVLTTWRVYCVLHPMYLEIDKEEKG